MTREVPLTKGYVALVDEEDYALVSRFKWMLNGNPKKRACCYAVTSDDSRVAMHRMIIGARAGQVIDHANGDGLDNRRANLRPCTQQQNMRNRRISKNNQSGFKGVYRRAGERRFAAALTVDKKQITVGWYDTALEAGVAYDLAAKQLFGEFARLNFPPHRDWILPPVKVRLARSR